MREAATVRRVRCTVAATPNRHGAARLESDHGRTYHVVDAERDDAEAALVDAEAGDRLVVGLVPVGARGNAWRATSVRSARNVLPTVAGGVER